MFKLMTIIHVKDFNAWQKVFNESQEMRVKAGVKDEQVFQGVRDKNKVTIITDWENPDQAKAFSQSAELRDTQQRAGVSTKPEVYVLQSL